MKSKLLIWAAALLVVAGVVRRFERPVLAQVRAALVENIDEPGRNPLELATGGGFQANWTVPAGKRWVIETYTAQCDVDTTSYLTDVSLNQINVGAAFTVSTSPHYVQANGSVAGHAVNSWIGTGSGPFYADAGSFVFMSTDTESANLPIRDCHYTLMGHVINNP